MSIERLTTKYALGAQVDEKFTKTKANEIIDAINDIIDGTTTLTEVEVANGTAAAPSVTFTSDADTGLYRAAANELGVTAGGTGQVIFADGSIKPVTDNDIDLGTSLLEFKDLYIDGTANIDALVADTADINAGTIDNTVIGATTPVAASVTSLGLGTDITGVKEVNHVITVATTTTAATSGGNIDILGGTGATSGAGGAINITGGTAGATAGSTGGAVNVTSGNSGAGNGPSGQAKLKSGGSTAADTGVVTVASGNAVTSGNSGQTLIQTGTVGTGDSGNVAISTGASTVGGTGDITLTTGNTASGLAGDIILTPGTHTSATVQPIISLNKAVIRKPASATVASGGTITGPELVGGLITATGATGNWQLPTTAQITTAIGSTPAGTYFDFVFNAAGMTGTNTATLVVGTNMTVMSAPPITGGGTLTVTQDTQVVGHFRITYDSATTCKISRIA